MKIFPILIITIVAFSACAQEDAKTPPTAPIVIDPIIIDTNLEETATENVDDEEEENDFEFVIKNTNEIYLSGEKVGEVLDGGIVNLEYEGKTISFIAGTSEESPEDIAARIYNHDNDQTEKRSLRFSNDDGYGLDIGKTFFGPYDTMEVFDAENIKFECDSTPILDLKSGNVTVAKCETNGVDYLVQYECTPGGVNPITTGGEVTLDWNKIYLKKLDGELYVFAGALSYGGVFYDYESVDGGENRVTEESKKRIEEYCSEDTLDSAIAGFTKSQGAGLMDTWDELVLSFKVVE